MRARTVKSAVTNAIGIIINSNAERKKYSLGKAVTWSDIHRVSFIMSVTRKFNHYMSLVWGVIVICINYSDCIIKLYSVLKSETGAWKNAKYPAVTYLWPDSCGNESWFSPFYRNIRRSIKIIACRTCCCSFRQFNAVVNFFYIFSFGKAFEPILFKLLKTYLFKLCYFIHNLSSPFSVIYVGTIVAFYSRSDLNIASAFSAHSRNKIIAFFTKWNSAQKCIVICFYILWQSVYISLNLS